MNVSGATKSGVPQLRGGGDVPVRGVVVLDGAGILAYLLAADEVGAVHLVVVPDPRFER